MKFSVTVVTVILIVSFVKAQTIKEKVPIFLESLQKLYRCPLEITTNSGAEVQTKWITQRLDHFDKKNERTWEMRYMVNEKHFENNGPIFIFLGGEWIIEPGRIKRGHFFDLAKEQKGILFYTEHRYYGLSQPTSDLNNENLQYLNVKHALADLAHFIRTQRKTDPRLMNSKVILAGCSYSASMVVWFKNLYPELINGGWALSAPVNAKVSFWEYHVVSGKAWRDLGSQECYNRINNGIANLEAMIIGTRSAEVKAMFQLCDSFDRLNDLDIWLLFATIADTFAYVTQYQQENEIPHSCKFLMNFEEDSNAVVNLFLLLTRKKNSCLEITYKNTLNYLKVSKFPSYHRSWFYQTCNEFGWYQTSESNSQPFGTKIPTILLTTLCYDTFGSNYTEEHIYKLIANTNEEFGGENLNVTNIYMTYGAYDPWKEVGYKKTNEVTILPRASHCADLESISDRDSPAMVASKERVRELVRQWLA